MANSRKANDVVKLAMLDKIKEFLEAEGEDVCRVKAGEIALPFVNDSGDEGWLKITFAVPSGSRDGEPYDGYGEAESYKMLVKDKAEKAKKASEAKKKKIEKDKKYREKLAAQKRSE